MHCVVCDQNETAVAVCRRCGGGVCRAHLRIVLHPGAPGGMLGVSAPSRECVCHLCARVGLAGQSAGQITSNALPAGDLPDAETLLQVVETLLSDKKRAPPQRSWQRRWQALLHRMLPGRGSRRAQERRV
jgi:hypothetical protein